MSDTTPHPATGFEGLLSDLTALTYGREKVPLSAILATLGARGHGPLILILALLLMLPTGMIPLLPVAIGVLYLLTAFEVVVGGRGVSVPRRIGRVELSAETLRNALERMGPMTARLGRVLHPRAPAFVEGSLSQVLVALVLVVTGVLMIVFGLIPGIPFVLCIPALILGAGLTAGDGRAVVIGFAAASAAAIAVAALLA